MSGSGRTAPAGPWTWSAAGTGSLDGLELRLSASRPVACHWEAAGSSGEGGEAGEGGGMAARTLTGRDPWIAALGESAGDLLRLGRTLLGHAGERQARSPRACAPWPPAWQHHRGSRAAH